MKFRKAVIIDAEKIGEIEYLGEYKWRLSKEAEIKIARNNLKRKNSETYMLEKNKKRIAYFTISIKKKLCRLDFLSVIKMYQRKGIGSLLMRKIISIAKNKKYKKIKLTVWSKNFSAIGLYNKFGFYVISIKKRNYPNGDDKLTMIKDISI